MLGNNSHCSLEHLHKSVSLPVSSSYLVPTCITTYTVDHNGRTIQRNIVLQPLFGRPGNNIIHSNSWTFRSLNCARRSLEGCCHVLTPLMVFLCLEGLVIRVALRLCSLILQAGLARISSTNVMKMIWKMTLQSFYVLSNNHCDAFAILDSTCHLPHLRKLILENSSSFFLWSPYDMQTRLDSSISSRYIHDVSQPDILNRPLTAIEWRLQITLPHLESLNDLKCFRFL